jgi:DNA topoisomerase-1
LKKPFVPLTVQQQRSQQQDDCAAPDEPPLSSATTKLLKRLRLKYGSTTELTIRRQRHGRGFGYFGPDGKSVTMAEKRRLAALAVPPAYEDVLYAADAAAHIQAIGRDSAGRLQYRYHPQWERARDAQSAPARPAGGRAAAHSLAAAVELVARSDIRPGSEQYARHARHARRGNAA